MYKKLLQEAKNAYFLSRTSVYRTEYNHGICNGIELSLIAACTPEASAALEDLIDYKASFNAESIAA